VSQKNQGLLPWGAYSPAWEVYTNQAVTNVKGPGLEVSCPHPAGRSHLGEEGAEGGC
jgi:hypothetical protein